MVKLKTIFTQKYENAQTERDYKEAVWIRYKNLIRIMTLLFVVFWIYQTIYGIAFSGYPSNSYTNIVRWVVYTPLTFGLVILAFVGPFRRKWITTLWFIMLSAYSIVLGFSSTFKTILCIEGILTVNCLISERPTLQNTDFYVIIGPVIMLLICLNDRRWQLLAMVLYVACIVVGIFIAGLAGQILSWISFVILIGAYLLSLAISYIQEEQNRRRFTLQRNLQTEVAERTKMQNIQETAEREKDAFVSYIFHEIRVPLNIVKLSVNLLDSDATFDINLSEEEKDLFSKMRIGIKNIESVLSDAGDYSTLNIGRIRIENKPFDLLKAFENMLWIMETSWKEKNLEFVKSYDSKLIDLKNKVIGDETRLRQATNNYISNAIKFTPPGGTIDLSVTVPSLTTVDIDIHVEVRDTGIGISPENQRKLFRRYVQIDPQKTQSGGGTGLGLSIVADILNTVGGKYGVESQVGQGSRFWFEMRMPLSDIAIERQKLPNVGINGRHDSGLETRSFYILVVDDDTVTRKLIVKILHQLGHETDEAVDGLECIEKVGATRASGARPYDIISIDNLMPRMKGEQAIRYLRQNNFNLPVISFTATNTEDDRQRMFNSGATHVLSKPSSLRDIEQTLSTIARTLPKT